MKSATPRGVGFAPVVDFTPEGTTYLASSAVGLDNNRVRLYGYSNSADALLPFPAHAVSTVNEQRRWKNGKFARIYAPGWDEPGGGGLFDGGRRTGLTRRNESFDFARAKGNARSIAFGRQALVVCNNRVNVVVELSGVFVANPPDLFHDQIYHNLSLPSTAQECKGPAGDIRVPEKQLQGAARPRRFAMCLQFQVSKNSIRLHVATATCNASSIALAGMSPRFTKRRAKSPALSSTASTASPSSWARRLAAADSSPRAASRKTMSET